MIMWIAAIVLMALMISIGYRQGAIRAAFTFLGILLALVLAMPMAPLFNFIFNFIHVHPAVPQFVTPLIAFLVVSIVMSIAGAFVFKKVDYHYRYHVSDAHRAFWERMHRRVGAAVGSLNGLLYFLAFALFVSVGGYLAIQTGGDESDSKLMKFMAKGAQDLKETKMDKVVAPFNPAPKKFFEVSDILGLLYHNRGLKQRLYNYPVFAAMAERPMFQALGSDQGVQKLVDAAPLSELLANEKVQEVYTNADLYNEFMAMDLKDVRTYLETGVSPKFAEEKILGRWAYDVDATLALNKASKSDMPASTWFRLKRELTDKYKGSAFTAFYDKKAALKISSAMEGKGSPVTPYPAANRQTNYIAVWWNTNATYSASGTWNGAAPVYMVDLSNKNGKHRSEVKLSENNRRLSFEFEEQQLAFDRLPD
jgi:uncharacterized membrane protein required for colicin V production